MRLKIWITKKADESRIESGEIKFVASVKVYTHKSEDQTED
jgi:hypothetical protein